MVPYEEGDLIRKRLTQREKDEERLRALRKSNPMGHITVADLKAVLKLCDEKEAALEKRLEEATTEKELEAIIAEFDEIKRVRVEVGIMAFTC